MDTSSRSAVLQRIRERIKPENQVFIDKNFQISKQVAVLLEKKGWTQKDFARYMGKQESEVSKWLSGLHNLTLQSVAKMEATLGEEILTTPIEACRKYSKIEYVTLRVYARTNSQQNVSGFDFSRDVSFKNTENHKIRVA